MSWWVFGVIVVGPIPGVKRANHKTAIMALRSAHDAPKCFAVVPLSPCLLATDVCLVHLDQPGESLWRPGRTMARRNLWSHDHAVLYSHRACG